LTLSVILQIVKQGGVALISQSHSVASRAEIRGNGGTSVYKHLLRSTLASCPMEELRTDERGIDYSEGRLLHKKNV